MRKVYVNGKQVEKLLNSKNLYTWFLMKDKSIERVFTFEYNLELNKKASFLVSC
jgi:2-polyprenyl-3-methyl-5-hydroxy-6-metoxy-1,4-benzoquinol methylase